MTAGEDRSGGRDLSGGLGQNRADLTLSDLLAASRRRAPVLAVCAVLGVLGALLATVLARPAYEARAKLLIEEPSGLPSSLSSLAGVPGLSTLAGGSATVTAEIERLRSRALLRRVLVGSTPEALDDDQLVPVVLDVESASTYDSLGRKLGWIVGAAPAADRPADELVRLELERWGYGPDESRLFLVEIGPDGAARVGLPDWTGTHFAGTPVEGRAGAYGREEGTPSEGTEFQLDRARFRVAARAESEGRRFLVGARTLRQAVDELQDTLVVEEQKRGSNVLNLTYFGPTPAHSARLVNRLVDAYVLSRETLSRDDSTRSIDYLQRELERIGSELSGAEEAGRDWSAEVGRIALPETTVALVENLVEVELERTRAEYSAASLERLQRSIEEGELGEEELIALEQADATPSGTVESLVGLVAQREALRVTYNEDWPELKAVVTEIDGRLGAVATQLGARIDQELRRVGDLRQVEQDLGGELARLPETQLAYARHERSVRTLAEIQTFLRGQLEDARVRLAATSPNVEVLDRAVVPLYRAKPALKMNLALGGLVGLALGVLCGLMLELRRPVVAPARMGELAGAPVLAHLRLGRWGRWLPARDAPDGVAADGLRVLRLALLQEGTRRGSLRSVAVVDTRPGDVATRVLANLAFSLVASGERVLLMDADARRHRLSRRLGLTPRPLALGPKILDEGVESAGLDELELLALGGDLALADQVDKGLARGVFSAAVERWDRVLCDASLGRAPADALALCRCVEGVVLVARSGGAGEGEIADGAADLRRVGATLVGVVLVDA